MEPAETGARDASSHSKALPVGEGGASSAGGGGDSLMDKVVEMGFEMREMRVCEQFSDGVSMRVA